MENFTFRTESHCVAANISKSFLLLLAFLFSMFVATNSFAQSVITVTSTGGTESCSSHIEFVISGATNTYLTLALVNGTAIGAGQDFGSNSSSNLQVYNGSAWENYTNYIIIPASGFVLVRTPLVADALNESTENFQLKATPISSAVAGLPVYDVNYQVIDLTTMTLLSGTAEQVNAVYRKTNAITVAGQAIDVRVTITGRSNVGIGQNDFVFDDDGSNTSRFQPQINSTSSSGSYVDFSFKFYLSGTTTQVALENFYVTGVDVDGASASATEFIELKNISSYSIDNSSLLTVTPEFRPGFTRFYGIPSSLNGITFENSASFVANYLDPLDVLEMRLGFSGIAGSARLFSLNLGSSVGSFSTSSTTNDADIVFGTASINNTPNEVCNGIDDDCDGSIDEGVQNNYYADTDGDGYGAGTATAACTAPAGFVATNTDCNSTNAAVYPGATEICNSIDDDCDTQIDEGLTFTNYYADTDADGYGAGTATNACAQPVGFVTSNTDCNNSNSAVNPGATEICNSIDDDCDTQIDEGLTFTNYYADADADGYGAGTATNACAQPVGFVTSNTDCNNSNSAVYPGATEICGNGIDENCNGSDLACAVPGCTDVTACNYNASATVSNGSCTYASTWYVDADSDGYYVSTSLSCTSPGANYNAVGGVNGDCNDNSASVNAGVTEICNSIDDDCDTQIDEGVQNNYYADTDGDGYGAGTATAACTAPAGYVTTNTDCNSTNAAVYPGATEVCNSIDDDCDTQIDEGLAFTNYYADVDGDGFGAGTVTSACAQPVGFVTTNTDCNNTSAAVYPGATEVCNSIDDDCDTQIDEGLTFTNYYADVDGDGFGAGAATSACAQPLGFVTTNTDCNNTSAAVYPGATEVCNSIDDDCDTQIDEGVQNTYYLDADGDSYGAAASSVQACTLPVGYVTNSSDCNDTNIAINPTTVWYLNADGDGYYVWTSVSCTSPGVNYNTTGGIAGDCNDTNAAVNAGATEICNGIDDDCDAKIDENSLNGY